MWERFSEFLGGLDIHSPVKCDGIPSYTACPTNSKAFYLTHGWMCNKCDIVLYEYTRRNALQSIQRVHQSI